MRPGARIAAAIAVLEDIRAHHRPASIALADWGRKHRFAGSGDRAAIGTHVYDALRRRASAGWVMGDDTPRALMLGTLALADDASEDAIAALFDGSEHAPAALADAERARLAMASQLADAPPHVQADVPEWLWPAFEDAFEDEAVAEGQALAMRAPTDLRVNALKADTPRVIKSLGKVKMVPASIARLGLRLPAPAGSGRTPNVQNEAAFQKGWFEVQDAGSQIVADLVFAKPGEQILDFCAGGGGKTLALAAAMDNRGQIHAYDSDKSRLAPIHQRLKRAGVRNAQVHTPTSEGPLSDLAGLVGRMDRVVIDAPCTGTGVWRRRPDAKWRVSPEALETRLAQQRAILDDARNFVRPGGYLCYITCSVLPAENEQQVHAFVNENPDFELVSAEEAWRELFGMNAPSPWSDDLVSLRLTPAATQTDGFYFAVTERRHEE
ncbi:MAG: RsmB/NOP family class I SAM-dependent RNA methyltransferase [Pseudomonadota bacterium]